jgi:hypothetical protein
LIPALEIVDARTIYILQVIEMHRPSRRYHYFSILNFNEGHVILADTYATIYNNITDSLRSAKLALALTLDH